MYRPIYCTYPGGHIMCNNQSCQASLALAHSITLLRSDDEDDIISMLYQLFQEPLTGANNEWKFWGGGVTPILRRHKTRPQ